MGLPTSTPEPDGYHVDIVDVAPFPAGVGDAEAHRLGADVRARLGTARIWHVNSTAAGGGVAELLHSSIARHTVLGLPTTWLVSNAAEAFFELTKRVHHGLHGSPAVGVLTAEDTERYRAATHRQAANLLAHIAAGDLVVLHDPQTLGAAPHLLAAGARVAWRSHIGTTDPNEHSDATWVLLRPYLDGVRHCVFTVADYAPRFIPAARVRVIRPSIDPYAAKNLDLTEEQVGALLRRVGLTGPVPDGGDSEPIGRVIQDQPLGPATPVVLQVSRWDPLKDMTAVMRAFAGHIAHRGDAHLVLAGPDPADVADDPEGTTVFTEVLRLYGGLPADVRARVHIVMLSLRDAHTNALVVNALQRRATVICQKSLQEGFGLTVTEAMWKGRPVVATRVGGIPAQIDSDRVGVLIDDPTDIAAFSDAVVALLDDPDRAAALGAAARARCHAEFLTERELVDYLHLYAAMLAS